MTTLIEYIDEHGPAKLAGEWNCTERAIRSWKWGQRLPSIDQAKTIIRNSNSELDYVDIFGDPWAKES